jgi:hypothetical protein
MAAQSFTYDTAAGRYRGPSGRFVPEQSVREAVDAVVDGGTQRVARLTQQLVDGALDLPGWQQQMAAELKSLHLATAVAGHGGWAQMAPADFGWVGQRLRTQYEYLRGFAADLASGAQPLDGRAVNRARLYGEAARQGYYEMQRRDGRLHGATQERRVLHAAESCAGCVAQAGRGWQPAGTLPPLGSQPCLSRCRCTWETQRGAA